MATEVYRELTVQFQPGNLREGSLFGRNFLIAPVVAMVEGVRAGANQTAPELGLASEFGENPIIWANRPLVLNHPKVGDDFVSANTADILEKYAFGMTMNPRLSEDNKKLQMEAWIDTARADSLGGDFPTTVNRIRRGDNVEVSVGFFSNVDPTPGVFNTQVYTGIWRNIKPDHLAILAEGTIGACSQDDGCGVPRLQAAPDLVTQPSPNKGEAKTDFISRCMSSAESKSSFPDQKQRAAFCHSQWDRKGKAKAQESEMSDHCTCQDQVVQADPDPEDDKPLTQGMLRRFFADLFKPFWAEPPAQQDFVGDKVILQTSAGVPLQPVRSETDVNLSGTPVIPVIQVIKQQENDMAQEPKPADPTPTPAPTEPSPAPPPDQPAAVTAPAPVSLTAQEYIDQAPAEIREVLSSSLKAHQATHAAAVKTLMNAKGNKFTEEFLKTQTLEVLENMISLLPPSYSGVAPAAQTRFETGEDHGNVPVRRVFEQKTASA